MLLNNVINTVHELFRFTKQRQGTSCFFFFFFPQYKAKLVESNSIALAKTAQPKKKEFFLESLQQAFGEQMFF